MSKKYDRALLTSGLAGALKVSATIIVACVFSAMEPGVVTAQTAEDSAAIRTQVEAYQSAWNTHNPSAVATFFAEDADFVMDNLPAVRGRSEIQDWWQAYFERQESKRRLTLEVSPVRFVAADVALVNVVTTTGGRDRQGQELPVRRFRGTWLWHCQNSKWVISAMRGMPAEEDSVVLTATLKTAESLRPHVCAFVDAYEDAFNSHDPSAVSAFYRKDADIIVRNSPLIHGTQTIQDWWRSYFSAPRPYRALFIIDKIRTISADVVLINFIVTGAVGKAEDEPRPLRYTRGTWVLVRESGEWLIAAVRVMPSEEDRIIRR